ncbi:MAG TPA: multicopper oxidase domain-containing protein [Nocardioidaceae bacterium]|nr:multicopper oxidase domain-containing protein [Nocardioidaceae bacterium]
MSRRRGFSPLRDLPALLWLILLLGVVLVHPFVPAPRWLMIHLLLLGAVSHSILVWSQHFADTLLHTAPRPSDVRTRSVRLGMLNGGVVVVVAGVLSDVWPVTAAGATAVAGAAGWHGVALVGQLRRALPARFGATVRYYVAAAAMLPVGGFLGVLMARGLGDPRHVEVMLAHAAVNVLGWMGLTVVGTLVTLWPTMLRTRIAPGAERAAQRALPALVGGVVVTAAGALAGQRLVAALGLVGYLAGLAVVAVPFATAARGRPPAHFPTLSVLAATAWLVGCVGALAVGVGSAQSWEAAHDRVEWFTPALAAGFGAQVLLGALSYLIPVALGGGPTPVRVANTVLDRGSALRVVLANGGLLVCLLPVPTVVRVLASALVAGSLAGFVPLLFAAMRASRRAKAAQAGVDGPAGGSAGGPARPHGPAPAAGVRPNGQLRGLAAVGLAAVVLAVAAGVALDPSALTGTAASASAGVRANGQTKTVAVHAANMRFTPAVIEIPAGTRLVIELTNASEGDVHDLVFDSGADSGRLWPGESTTVDVGVVGRDLDGWCSVLGHRQMGMVLAVHATGTAPAAAGSESGSTSDGHTGHHHGPAAAEPAPRTDPVTDAGGEHEHVPAAVQDAGLPPLEDGRVHRHTFTVSETELEVAPGVTQRLWTYNGSAPGPVLHGRVGDRFEITLVNDGTIGHSIDFHAGALAPDGPMRTIPPGESLSFGFTARRAGIWMYHCSSMPMSAHIANGMFGAVVIEPRDLEPVDRSYLLVQSEQYHGPPGGVVDMDKLQAERPDAVVFNGYPDQYDTQPLTARVGERVRIWLLDAGPNRGTSFHVVGGQFDTVYAEGGYLLRPGQAAGQDDSGGSQALALAPAQAGFVELTFGEAGHYPFVSHVMVDAERGAHGVIEVRRAAR